MKAYLIAGLFGLAGLTGCSDYDFDDDRHGRHEYRTREVHHHYDDDNDRHRHVRGTDHDRAHRKVYRTGDRDDVRRHNRRWH